MDTLGALMNALIIGGYKKYPSWLTTGLDYSKN